ncbi:MAG: LytTR family transcriptional regulator DNA-binding domain-containing protein [Pseudomonadota bacterium]
MQNPANDTALSLTLRQLQGSLRSPLFWLVIVAAVGMTSMAGPYYTLERFSFPERLVYWGTTIILSAILMTFLSILAHRLTEEREAPWMVIAAVAGMLGAVPVIGTLYLAEGFATGFATGWGDPAKAWQLLPYTVPSVVAVTVIVNAIIVYQQTPDAPPLSEAPTLSQLQRKLPHHLGHDIVCVQAQDHYVEVTTPNGSAMVLMRLGDAVVDLGSMQGMQVHRSWWISLAHIAEVIRGPNGPEARMTSGQVVPIGRSFRKAFQDAHSG